MPLLTEKKNHILSLTLSRPPMAVPGQSMALEMSKDKEEAHKAWREKREPKFTGE